MNISAFLDSLALWVAFLASVVIILLSIECGFRLGKRERGRSSETATFYTGPVVGACLGLLAFMLAFTFGVVTSRIDYRKQLVLDEANAVGTAYLRAEVLPTAARSDLQGLLREYVDVRLQAPSLDRLEDILPFVKRSEELHREMWSRAIAASEKSPGPLSSILLQSLNDVIDLHQTRISVTVDYRMPSIYWILLYVLTILAMAIQGYDAGVNGSSRSATVLMSTALAFSVVLLLIIALDRPAGAQISGAAMLDLKATMEPPVQATPEASGG